MRRKLSLVFVVLVLSVLALAQPVLTQRAPKAVLKDLEDVSVMASTIDGELIAAAGQNGGGIILYNVAKNNPQRFFEQPTEKYVDLSFANDKVYLAGLGVDGSVRIWNVRVLTGDEQGKNLLKTYTRTIANPKAIALGAVTQIGKRYLAVASEDGILKLYDVFALTEKAIDQVDLNMPVSDMFFLSDGRTLVAVSKEVLVLVNVDEIRNVKASIKTLAIVPNRQITLNAAVTAVAQMNYVEKDAALLGLEDGSIAYVNFAKEVAGTENEVFYVAKLFDAPVTTLAVSSYPKRERVVFAASDVMTIPLKDIDSRVRLLSNRDKLTDVVYLGTGRNEVYDEGSAIQGYEGATYVGSSGAGAANTVTVEAPSYRYDYATLKEVLQLEERTIPVAMTNALVRVVRDGEVVIERQLQQLCMFVLDLKETKDPELAKVKGIYVPRVFAFDYKWLSASEVDQIRNIKSAVIDPFLDRYYERFTRNSQTLDRNSFYLVLGTEEELVRVNMNYEANKRVLPEQLGQASGSYSAKLVTKLDYYGPKQYVENFKVTANGRYLLALDGKAAGVIKIWDLTLADSMKPGENEPAIVRTAPVVAFRPANDLPIVDFFSISELGLLVVTDGQEVIALRAEKGFAGVMSRTDTFVPYARYSAINRARFIQIEAYYSGRENKYFALAFLSNGQVMVIELGGLKDGKFVPTSGYWRLIGQEFPRNIEAVRVKIIHHQKEPGTLEPYIITVEKFLDARTEEERYALRFWRLLGDELITEINPGALVETPESITVSEDGAYIAVSTKDSVKVYKFADLLKLWTRPFNIIEEKNVTALAILPGGAGKLPTVVMGKDTGEVYLAQLVDKAQAVISSTQAFVAHENAKIFRIIARGAYLVTSSEDETIKIW